MTYNERGFNAKWIFVRQQKKKADPDPDSEYVSGEGLIKITAFPCPDRHFPPGVLGDFREVSEHFWD